MSSPVASVEITASSRSLTAKLREARAKFAQFADGVKAQMGAVRANLSKNALGDPSKGGFFAKAAATAVSDLASTATSKAIGYLSDLGHEAYSFNDNLKRLQITAEATPADMEKLSSTIRQASDATGISKTQILAASSAYVALTGDMATAQASTLTWARVAQATNTPIDAVSSAAAAMTQQLKIMPDQAEAAFSALTIQGKKGAVEIKDLAGLLAQIAPQWAQFKDGQGMQGVTELGAALQIVKRGFGGDAGETVTGLQSLLTSFQKNAKHFTDAGIRIYDPKKGGGKEMRNVLDIVDAIGKSKLVNDPTAMEKAFGRVEAYRAYLQLSQNRDALKDLVNASGDATVIQKDLDSYMQSTAGRVGQSWEQAKNRVLDMFTPERIQAFADVAVGLLGALGEIAGKVASVLDTAKGFGVGLAKVIGGETEDDKIEHMKTDRYEERKRIAAFGYQSENPGMSYEDAQALATKQLGREDAVRNNLWTQGRGGNISRPDIEASQINASNAQLRGMLPGVLANSLQDKATTRGNYTIAELTALSKNVKGSTDELQTQQAIVTALKRAIAESLQITVRIGEEAVANAQSASKTHRAVVKQ